MPIKSAYAEEDETQVNLTPMIDVVFLLIIFFMVATKFHELVREIDVKLAETTDAQPLTEAPQEIIINVMHDGSILLWGKTQTREQLADRLVKAKESYPDQRVRIRGDKRTVYEHLAKVLGTCKGAGINTITLEVLEEKER